MASSNILPDLHAPRGEKAERGQRAGIVRLVVRILFVVSICGALCGCGSGGGRASSTGPSGPSGPPPDQPVTSAHAPVRTRYLRTDIQYLPNALEGFPPHFAAYDSVHQRFFVSNPTLNAIHVFDDATESQIGSIIIPFPWGIDVAPDGSKMYAATGFGDVYLIDPSTLSVLQRFPSTTIGPQTEPGFPPFNAIEPFILADGQLALLGKVGSPWLNGDGSGPFAIWNPSTNSFQELDITTYGFDGVGQMVLTADRTKVIFTAINLDLIGLYDPSTGTVIAERDMGTTSQILPTPDGTRIVLDHLINGGEFEILDASTLEHIGDFSFSGVSGARSAALSSDGSTLFAADLLGDVTAYDTTTYAQKGWVPNFDILDGQQSIVLSATDQSGLIVGPTGHGVAFLDTSQIEPGMAQTIFTLGFISPGTGSTSGGTSIQAEISEQNASSAENITSGTFYIGNSATNDASLSNQSVTATTPPASAIGVVDSTLVLQDGSIQLNPENFSYGPTIVELSTNAASADGGAQGVIFGYGLGQQPSDVTVGVGGQSAAVTEVIPSASPISPYPFPMEAVLFTIPPGTAGNAATVIATTQYGSATSSVPLNYVPAVQQFPLSGASLMQGLYDSTRGVVYFTDQSQVEVFSPSSNAWLPPIAISYTNSNSILAGVALSPDSNTMAISDAGNGKIYLLNPSSPVSVQAFNVLNYEGEPYGLAVTNSGMVYYGTDLSGVDPPGGFFQLNTGTGAITRYQGWNNGDEFMRVLISPNGGSVYFSNGGCPAILNTSTNSIVSPYLPCNLGDGNEDMALSADGTALLTTDLLTDSNMNIDGDIAYVDRDTWLAAAVYGQKLNSDGSLEYTPLTTGIDVHNTTSGLLVYRVELPIQLADAYDALAIDNADGLLFAITANGIAEINLSSLPETSAHVNVLKKRRNNPFSLNAQGQKQSRSTHNIYNDLPHLRYPGRLQLTPPNRSHLDWH